MATKITTCDTRQSPNRPTGRKAVTVTVADAQTVGATIIPFNGIIWAHLCSIADMTGAGTTATMALLDEDTTSYYSLGSLTENAKTFTKFTDANRIAYAGMLKVQITQTVAQSGSAATHTVVLYYQ